MKNKVLILFAHPSQSRSEANIPLFRAAQDIAGVTTVDLYAEYPTLKIDIDREQKRLVEHDVVIFQFPFYWYSTPAILKEWQDLVLEYGFAYGTGGTALNGKTFFCALTAGGSDKAYRADGFNHFTIRELLQPLEQTASLTGMHYLAPFALFNSRTAIDEGRLQEHIDNWKSLLMALVENRLDTGKAALLSYLNEDLSALIKASEGASS